MTIVYQTVTAGVSYSRTIVAPNAISFVAENLPTGLSISNFGIVSGTPQQLGRFAITILARGAGGTSAAILDLTIIAPLIPFITSSDYSSPETTQAFTYQITASSPTAILSYNATNLPTGLSVDTSTGLISGTPTVNSQSPSVNIISRLSATNAAGTGEQDLYFLLRQRPVITSSLATVSYNLNDSITPYTITATRSPTLFGATNLPPNLTLNSGNGIISGSVQQFPGDYSMTLSADNGVLIGTATKNIVVYSPPVIISGASFGNGVTYNGVASYQITALAYPAVTSYGSTTLPGTLSLNTSTGFITGIPPSGSNSFDVSATNSLGTDSKTVTVTGANPPPPPPPPPAPAFTSKYARTEFQRVPSGIIDFSSTFIATNSVTMDRVDATWPIANLGGPIAPLRRRPWWIYISWSNTTSYTITLDGQPISDARLAEVGLIYSEWSSGFNDLFLGSNDFISSGFPPDLPAVNPPAPPAVYWESEFGLGALNTAPFWPPGTYTLVITLTGPGGTTAETFTINLTG